jgi:hypothetical protein
MARANETDIPKIRGKKSRVFWKDKIDQLFK